MPSPTPRNTGAPQGPQSHSRVAIVAAMKMEIAPLLRRWRQQGKKVDIWSRHGAAATALLPGGSAYITDDAVVLCGGIGRRGAAMAAKAAMDYFSPSWLISAGLAGALRPGVAVGSVERPAKVIDARSGQELASAAAGGARGTLVTAASALSKEGKAKLADEFRALEAEWVDMEAAAVGEIAWASGLPFAVVKAVSDPLEFAMPDLDRFIGPGGRVHLLKLIGWACVRPSVWPVLAELRRNSSIAAEKLADELEKVVGPGPPIAP